MPQKPPPERNESGEARVSEELAMNLSGTPLSQFKRLARRILSVPHEEIKSESHKIKDETC
jgi:hypothetical protein